MSTFPGSVCELPDVAIDRFDGDNLGAKVFLLSHAHQDHMVGLDSNAFYDVVSSNEYVIYCHSITKQLLACDQRYRRLDQFVIGIDVDDTVVIESNGETSASDTSNGTINLTLLKAGHCPGSVMFLLESRASVVLYTGDFRLSKPDIDTQVAKIKRRCANRPIDTVYFDSTFCTQETYRFPPRERTLDVLIRLIDEWRRSNTARIVRLHCCARYGHEMLLEKLACHYSTRVHVSASKYEALRFVGCLRDYTTTNAHESGLWLHACAFYNGDEELESQNDANCSVMFHARGGGVPCDVVRQTGPRNTLVLKPCILQLAQSVGTEIPMYQFDQTTGTCRVQYSCHSSLEEVLHLLNGLSPTNIVPCVKPAGSTETAVKELIDRHRKRLRSIRQAVVGQDENSYASGSTPPTASSTTRVGRPLSLKRRMRLMQDSAARQGQEHSNHTGESESRTEEANISDIVTNSTQSPASTQAYRLMFGDFVEL